MAAGWLSFWLLLLMVGSLLGALAHYLLPGRDNRSIRIPVVVGVVGSWIGGFLASALGFGLVPYWILSVLGATITLSIYGYFMRQTGSSGPGRKTSAPLPFVAPSLPKAPAPQASVPTIPTGADVEHPAPSASGGKIFLSYASPDRPTAQRLARALENEGWSVWWDRSIPPGKTFAEVIESALGAARCVIVLWSEDSVNSDWVKTEADEAAKRRILIPALIAEVTIPFEFRRLQAANLIDWQGLGTHGGYQSLIGSVNELLSKPQTATEHR